MSHKSPDAIAPRAQSLCANDSCNAGEFAAGTLNEGDPQVPTHKGERGGVSDSHFFFACFFRSRRRISNHVGFMFFGFFLHSS